MYVQQTAGLDSDDAATLLSVLARVREGDFTARMPVDWIGGAGKVVGGERDRCLEAGANDYITKPVDTAELINAIEPWLPAKATPAA